MTRRIFFLRTVRAGPLIRDLAVIAGRRATVCGNVQRNRSVATAKSRPRSRFDHGCRIHHILRLP